MIIILELFFLLLFFLLLFYYFIFIYKIIRFYLLYLLYYLYIVTNIKYNKLYKYIKIFMCSIEEAWAGQNFDGLKVSSQGDIHNAYLSIPDTLLNKNNEFKVDNFNQPQPRTLSRGINATLLREQRLPNILRNSNNSMPHTTNYVEPIPSYMSLSDTPQSTQSTHSTQSTQSTQSYPSPTLTGNNFTDIHSAFNVSDTVNHFMNINQEPFDNDLLEEDTYEDNNIINNKFNNMKVKNNKNEFSNINSKNNKQNNSDSEYENNNNNESKIDTNIQLVLMDILNKLNKIEQDLHNNNKRNLYDIILYIIVGMLLSFIIYSILSVNRK